MSLLRLRLRPGEPIAVYDTRRNVWVDARLGRRQPLNVSTVGYRVFLQRDIDRWKAPADSSPRKAPLVMHKIPSHLLRPRFPLGAKVLVYQDAGTGWVNATVEKLEPVTPEPKIVHMKGRTQNTGKMPKGAATGSAEIDMPAGYTVG